VPVNLFSVFYAKSIDLDMGVYGKLLALSYTVSLGLAYFLGWAADRFHPLRAGMAAIALYAAAMFWAGTCIHDNLTFGIAFVAHVVLSGAVGTTMASLGQRLFPVAKFAQFASALGIITSIATILLAPAVGTFLGYTGHIYRYTFLFGAILAILGLACMLLLHREFMARGGPRHYVAPE
jgi:MFS family permease